MKPYRMYLAAPVLALAVTTGWAATEATGTGPVLPAAQQAATLAMIQRAGPVLTNLRDEDTATGLENERMILLRNAVVYTGGKPSRRSGLVVPEALAAPVTAWQVVQFEPGQLEAGRSNLVDAGFQIGHYVPHHAWAVRGDRADLLALAAQAGIQHVEPYQPYFKLDARLLEVAMADPQTVLAAAAEGGETPLALSLLLHAGEKEPDAALAQLITVEQVAQVAGQVHVKFTASPSTLQVIARHEQVQWIEPRESYRVLNDLANRILRARALKLRRPDLTGSNLVIAVTDSGLDINHLDFAGRILAYTNRASLTADGFIGDRDGHGTHVSGSILGSGALSATVLKAPGSAGPPYFAGQFAGIAPGAQLVMIEDFNSFTDDEQVAFAWNQGARIMNNSWGGNSFGYSIGSMTWDALVRDALPNTPGNQRLLTFFAAGNDGNGNQNGTTSFRGNIGSPGNAKNVVTIGSLEQRRFAEHLPGNGDLQDTDSDWQVAATSSRGPVGALDLRIKPDLVAPGEYVLSTQSRETNPDILQEPFNNSVDYRAGNLDSGSNYAFYSGTSMATPLATGVGALFVEHFRAANNGTYPSPALVKAALIAGARNVNSLVYRFLPIIDQYVDGGTIDQGWGMVDAVRSVYGPGIHPGDQLALYDEFDQSGLASGGVMSFPVTVADGGLKVVLTWSDVPGNPGNLRALVNNLDLQVLGPGGVKYVGNYFGANGLHSQPMSVLASSGLDGYNNVEVVFVPDAVPPGAGSQDYTVQVIGRNVPEGPQRFALVVMTGIGREQRFTGREPAAAFGPDNALHVAFSALDANDQEQIFVKTWRGDIGDLSEANTWIRMADNWFSLGPSAYNVGISASIEASRQPSIDVTSNLVAVAWEHYDQGGTNSSIHVRGFDGMTWVEYGQSARGRGLAAGLDGLATQPALRFAPDGNPVVAWRQAHGSSNRIHVARWDGAQWIGYGTSMTSGIGLPRQADHPTLTFTAAGDPVVAWVDGYTGREGVYVWGWQSGNWSELGRRGSTATYQSFDPHLTTSPAGHLYLTWVQNASGSLKHVMVERYASGAWSGLAGSGTGSGISQTAQASWRYRAPTIAYAAEPEPSLLVAWHATNAAGPVLQMKRHVLGSGTWEGLSGSGTSNGIVTADAVSDAGGIAFSVSPLGSPVVVAELDSVADENEIVTHGLISDLTPPIFSGIANAVGGVSNVVVSWLPAADNFTTPTGMRYRVYVGTNSARCLDLIACDPADVFSSPITFLITNATSFTVTNLTAYESRCFGVRAIDEGGRMDDNLAVLEAYSLAATNRLCEDINEDSDTIPDWWEELWFGSNTGMPGVVYATCSGALTFDEAYLYGTDPLRCDSDGDGISDYDEVYLYNTLPTNADTDGDGLPDGDDANPHRAFLPGSDASDADILRLGYATNSFTSAYQTLYVWPGTNTTPTTSGWTKSYPDPLAPYNRWHLSTARPVEPLLLGTQVVQRINDPQTAYSFRMAVDTVAATNALATYEAGTNRWAAGFDSPPIDATGVDNLFLSFKEYLGLEINKDFARVLITGSAHMGPGFTNWTEVGVSGTGFRQDWSTRTIDLSSMAGQSNVRVRLLFATDTVNNHYAGWYVTDLRVYAGASVRVMVRGINGCPLPQTRIDAIGAGIITNSVDGHRIVNPGKVFASAKTDADGWATLRGIPRGWLVFRAEAPSHRISFWNGPLFSGGYGFGNLANPGVERVSDALVVNTTSGMPYPELHFELEGGQTPGYASVAFPDAPGTPVAVNYQTPVTSWNGDNTATGAAIIAYGAIASINEPFNDPAWDGPGGIRPNFIHTLAPGIDHLASLSNQWILAPLAMDLRGGEFTRTSLSTNIGNGFVDVTTRDGRSYPVRINGVLSGSNTPVRLRLLAGTHWISLDTPDRLTPGQAVTLAPATLARMLFTDAMLNGAEGLLDLQAFDRTGKALSNAAVLVHGRPLTSSLVPDLMTTTLPLRLPVKTGNYRISFAAPDYELPAMRQVVAGPSITSIVVRAIREADLDFDGVGDATEAIAYTNLFLFAGDDDPDNDGLTSAMEFSFVDLYGITLDASNPDSDGDGMLDGDEVGFDGLTNANGHIYYASSVLTSNTVTGGTALRIAFRGRYLEGISNFGTGQVDRISVDGLLVDTTSASLTYTAPTNRACAEMIMDGLPAGLVSNALQRGDIAGIRVFADTNPGQIDTDGDGMADGFEFDHQFITSQVFGVRRILDPIEAAGGDEDPDADGLDNLSEFNRGTIPNNPDTDGDGMPDGWEHYHGLNPLNPADALTDADGDGLPNLLEFQHGANPLVTDTDGDGLTDFEEVMIFDTKAYLADTDGDGLLDGLEVFVYGTDPLAWDTDGDGMPDGFEVLDAYGNPRPEGQRLNPLDPADADQDPDNDGLSNLQEYLVRDGLYGNLPAGVVWDYATDPFNPDSDGDGMTDGWEVQHGLHPMDPIVGANGDLVYRYPALGPLGDLDEDGLWNLRESQIQSPAYTTNSLINLLLTGTDPRNPDTDGDGLPDGEEDRVFASDPLQQDTDGDGLMDGAGVAGFWGEVQAPASALNHYDYATNDLWQLVWPIRNTFPYWTKVEPEPGSELPSPRWGHASSYVPVFETQFIIDPELNLKFTDKILDTIYYDNRQVVVLGGRDGITETNDIWEFVIASNVWRRSEAPALTERSGFSAITKVYDLPGADILRPNVIYFDDDRIFNTDNLDATYMFGGWDNRSVYKSEAYGFYKSTDDPRTVNVLVSLDATTAVATVVNKQPADWVFIDKVVINGDIEQKRPMVRKFHGLAYDYTRDRVLMVGGIDGNNVLGETFEGALRIKDGDVYWREVPLADGPRPSPRYGHSLIYNAQLDRFMLFGGFDANHQPMNELWLFKPAEFTEEVIENYDDTLYVITVTEEGTWEQVIPDAQADWPQPRGGASMIYFGDFDYDRGFSSLPDNVINAYDLFYCVNPNPQRLVLFGGTDRQQYFNDTWIYDGTRWILINPTGEASQGPEPRAFATLVYAQNADTPGDEFGDSEFIIQTKCASPTAFLFGGRLGTWPLGKDTDGDLVDDGLEHAISGPGAGRDPRWNALVHEERGEIQPYAFTRIGPMTGATVAPRITVADMESLHNAEGLYALPRNLPWEEFSRATNLTTVIPPTTNRWGVEAQVFTWDNLWAHRATEGSDAWELGVPVNHVDDPSTPPSARSGRRVFATGLANTYPQASTMDLFTPRFTLTLPNTATNVNTYYLIFHEWLDLARDIQAGGNTNALDYVQVDLIRPATEADGLTRVSGLTTPDVRLLGPRHYSANTTGAWRRVVVPVSLSGTDSNLFVRFRLVSHTNTTAAGWFIDDVALVQGGAIEGFGLGASPVLLGAADRRPLDVLIEQEGGYAHRLLPVGNYLISGAGGQEWSLNIRPGAWSPALTTSYALTGLTGYPFVMTWQAQSGATYAVQQSEDVVAGSWSNLSAPFTATGNLHTITETNATDLRFFRIIQMD